MNLRHVSGADRPSGYIWGFRCATQEAVTGHRAYAVFSATPNHPATRVVSALAIA